MGDNVPQSTLDNRHESAIVVVNMSDQPGSAVNALAKSLFRRLKSTVGDNPSLSVSIDDLSSDEKASPSWVITAESPGEIRRYLLEEFCLPPTEGPRFVDYFVWISRGPVRAVKYLSHRLHERVEAGSSWQRTTALIHMLPRIAIITAWVLSYYYLMLFISFVVAYPIRRWRLWMIVLYSLTVALLVFRFAWMSVLPSLVLRISQFTQELASIVSYRDLSFALLFPVVATVMIAAAISILTFLVGWMRRAIPKVDAWMFPTRGAVDFAYLLDPLYAATSGGAFEKRLLEAGNRKETQHLFVVCEHGAILLAYEVLSRICLGKISKPVHLMTRDLALAELPVEPSTDLWLLLEASDWPRFGKTTPCRLSWRYYHRRLLLSTEFTLKVDPTPQGRVPQVECKRIRKSWFKSSYSMLVDRLIALANQS